MDVTNWSHPFKDQSHPLSQLTQLANATAGYYPLGRNALWHGGVHFDSGTAGLLDQSAVYCVADGEVVAYRIDEHSPTTSYVDNDQCVAKPFSRNFVLVRHRLQPPCIEVCAQTPPSLTLYSVYMHLQDWVFYREDPTVARPAFWPEKATDGVAVLQAPVAIKAADLIGHIGLYQCGDAKKPERKLHLEVFSADDVEGFIDASRAWAQQLPASDKTWLKLAAGTAVVPHQKGFGVTQCPVPNGASPVSGADLLLPKALLDSLPPESKMTHVQGKASRWYRLDGLLLDADNHPLDGWVCETVGVTPWVSPWSWEGYAIVYSVDTSLNALAALLRDLGRLSEAQLARFGRVADEGNKGRIKSRLYDIIDRNRDGKITAAELQAAIRQPSHAQSISRLIIHTESEWSQPGKWDGLDEVLGHTRLTPNLNWLAEKQRINALCWWEEVAPKIGLPGNGAVYHFHPMGLVGQFRAVNPLAITPMQLKQIFPLASEADIDVVLNEINGRLTEFKLDTRLRQRHFFAQIKGEVGASMKGVTESWEYSPAVLKSFSAYYRAHPLEAEQDGYLKDSNGRIIRRANQHEIGVKHFLRLNGNRRSHPADGYNFRGRGLLQLTGYEKYKGFKAGYSRYWKGAVPDTVGQPDLINEMPTAIRSAIWFWINFNVFEEVQSGGYSDVVKVTKAVNGGGGGLEERKAAYRIAEGVLR
jgi:predicted chitinase